MTEPWDHLELVGPAGSGSVARVWHARAPRGDELALKLGRERGAASRLAVEAIHACLAACEQGVELLGVAMVRMADGRVERLGPDEDAADGLPALLLRWREGRPLAEQLAACADDVEARLGLAATVARDAGAVLADLHDAGLAHGDVKPANVICEPGRAWLVDLGMAGPVAALAPAGATPRYLAVGDEQLGDGRCRDLLALGLLLAETCDPGVAAASRPLAVAREACLPGPFGPICAALLAPEPGARPSARWLCERLAAGTGVTSSVTGQRSAARVRASYLRLRLGELLGATATDGAAARWLDEALGTVIAARALCRRCAVPVAPMLEPLVGRPPLGPLEPERRQRWLAALLGPVALQWRSATLASVAEPVLADALARLAAARPIAGWTLNDLEAALRGDEPPATVAGSEIDPRAPDAIVRLALGLARTPSDPAALAAVERHARELPAELVLRAADALRLGGELGRALGLVRGRTDAGSIAADVLRRAGEPVRAAAVAEQWIASGRDDDGRARACLARVHLDAGRIEAAAELVTEPGTAPVCEAAALVAVARGRRREALQLAERGRALADGAEEHARLAGTVAYVTRSDDPEAARRGFGEAADHAVRAGALLEEASYLTGQAATAVDCGRLDEALGAATRAALLFDEVLRRPAMAARAWLARVAAYAAVGCHHEARAAADQAVGCARAGGDRHAEAYALLGLAEAYAPGAADGAAAARRASELVSAGSPDDRLQAAAGMLRHAGLEPEALRAADALAQSDEAGPFARLAWWGARAERLGRGPLDEPAALDARGVLGALGALGQARAPLVTLGKAMHAARELASTLGDEAARQRFEVARDRAVRPVVVQSDGPLGAAARAAAWLGPGASATGPTEMATEQALDLQLLVRALGERRDLQSLLDRVLDVLLWWTRAERGMLLLRSADGQLRPRAARHLGRDDLRGEQLAVSTSLAQRALDRGEAVVAVDAMHDLGESYASVHALKLRSVLALPLSVRGEPLGVVYLDDRTRRAAFGPRQLGWAEAVAPVAAIAIDDARTQLRLRRAARRAERTARQLERALAHKQTALEVASRELGRTVEPDGPRRRHPEIVGRSEAITKLLDWIDRVAPTEIPVLLRGESGSGKELVARAIHRAGPRAAQPFVSENCSALPEALLESTLFGHVKGAFTGAHRTRVGLIEAAHGGTMLLDEVGEMSLAMQTKLLRVLEDGLVRPVGANRPSKVDVRIIAATHRDLEQMVAERSFREDLYYRLNVIGIQVPPLRERPRDIPLLVEHLIAKHAPGRSVAVSRAASERLGAYGWPGNVRQLENEIRRALLLCDQVMDVAHLTIPAQRGEAEVDLGLDIRARVDRLEGELVREALGRTGGNQTRAARLLGVSRFGLHKMMKRLGLQS